MKACLTALGCHRAEGSGSPLAKPESLWKHPSAKLPSFLKEGSYLPTTVPLFQKWIYCSTVWLSFLPFTLTGLRGKRRVLLYILADCSSYAPVSSGWGWGDGGVSKLYIELLTGAEALWFPWQPGWK